MSPGVVFEVLGAVFRLLERFERDDPRATGVLEDILPIGTFTRLVRERERARDKKKFGK